VAECVHALRRGSVHDLLDDGSGLEVVMTYYGILDRVPAGRNEGTQPTQAGCAATTSLPKPRDSAYGA